MLVSSFYIKKLFDLYTYKIDFTHYADNLCILTGANGYGKTTVLKIINSLSTLDLFFFYTISFEKIELVFSNSDKLEITHSSPSHGHEYDDDTVEYPDCVTFSYVNKNLNHRVLFDLNLEDITRLMPLSIRSEIDFSFIEEGRIEVLKNYLTNHKEIYEEIAANKGNKDFLSLLNELRTVFIPAQRLYYTEQEREHNYTNYRRSHFVRKSSIDRMISDLKNELQRKRLDYLLETQRHDNQFINKLLSSSSKGYDENIYNEKKDLLQERLDELFSYGLIEKTPINPYMESKKEILSVYIDDLLEKIDSYNELLKKIRLFSTILEKKEFANKKISFSPEHGLIATSANGTEINPNFLSSGEQNELIMLYDFIFRVENGTILLIDEPEISLHVSWQLDFLHDIESICNNKKIQVIVATHSPQIINEYWEACFDFYKNNNNE